MGRIREWINEMGEVWDRMAQGDPRAFIGLPPAGTSDFSTPDGRDLSTPDGNDWGTPDGDVLTERQLARLMEFFHQQYGRYPLTAFEFQQWLRANW